MSDFGYVQPDDGSSSDAWAQALATYGWWRTLLIPVTLAIVIIPVMVLPWVAVRAAYLLVAFPLWVTGIRRLLRWSMLTPAYRKLDRADDADGEPPALTGAHRKRRGRALLAGLPHHVRILGDELTVAHVRLGPPRFSGSANEQERAQRFVDQLAKQPGAERAVIVRTAAQELTVGFPDLEPDAVELVLAAAETAFAVEGDGSGVAIGLALLHDGETIDGVIARAEAASH